VEILRALLYCLALCLAAAPVSAGKTVGGDFTLYTTKGEAASLLSLRGKVVLMYFGFTHCPEMCPAELLQFKQLLSLLPPERKYQVQPIFVSLDPQRDTREVLDAYMDHFGKGILALTGSEQELRKVTEQYAARFRYVPTGSSYTVDHTVNTYVIDPAGNLARILPYGTSAEDMLGEVIKLLP
jgi:protein SCO1/2